MSICPEKIDANLEPGLLSESQLRTLVQNKGICISENIGKVELVELFLKYIQPQPQRQKRNQSTLHLKSASSLSNKASLNKPTTSGMSETLQRKEQENLKSDIKQNLDLEMMDITDQFVKKTKKIILKRSHGTHSNANDNSLNGSLSEEFIDEIKKAKLN